MRERSLHLITVFGLLAVLTSLPLAASSHREAPAITETPKVDGTDFYMFRSYEPGREGYVTLIANYVPLQDAYGGPNFFALDDAAEYAIHVENDGQPGSDLDFVFRFTNFPQGLSIPVGGETIPIPVVYAAPIPPNKPGGGGAANFATLYTLRLDTPGGTTLAQNVDKGGVFFAKPLDHAGQKTFPNYAAYANQFMYDLSIPGCGDGRVFVGQRKESFEVNLGEVFDLVNLNPVGPRDGEPSATEYKNVTSLALEVPIDCLTGPGDVIGGWTTASLPRTRTLVGDGSTQNSADFIQVSRLGMPLVNEVVIGLPDKDRFNASKPDDDLQFATYVTNPFLPELLQLLFGVQAPNNFPRLDLIATFVTGIPGLNELGFGEMLRLNTAIPPAPGDLQNNLGVLGGDNAGFPNGRRPGDDVVDIELRVAMGVLCHAFPGAFGCDPDDATDGLLPYTDETLQDPSQFDSAFPYLRSPLPGSPNGPNGID
jgi:hypothetical protein